MTSITSRLLIGTALAVCLVAPALAQRRHHSHHHVYRGEAPGYGVSQYDGIRPDRYYGFYPAGGWEGSAVARATIRAQNEPGVTSELAPYAKQTATGGPVGGVPGFSGGF